MHRYPLIIWRDRIRASTPTVSAVIIRYPAGIELRDKSSKALCDSWTVSTHIYCTEGNVPRVSNLVKTAQVRLEVRCREVCAQNWQHLHQNICVEEGLKGPGSERLYGLITNPKVKKIYNMATSLWFFRITYCNEHFNILTMLCKWEKVSFYMRVKRQILVKAYPKFLTDNLQATDTPPGIKQHWHAVLFLRRAKNKNLDSILIQNQKLWFD